MRTALPGGPCDGPPGTAALRMFGADLHYIVDEFVFRAFRAQACPANAVNTAVFLPCVSAPRVWHAFVVTS